MTTATNMGQYAADIDFIVHTCQGKDSIEVFHFHHFLNQKRKVRHVFFGCDAGDYDFDATNMIPRGCLDHII